MNCSKANKCCTKANKTITDMPFFNFFFFLFEQAYTTYVGLATMHIVIVIEKCLTSL